MTRPGPRLVIDTNVTLDLLLFDSQIAAPLLDAVTTGRAQWLTAPYCRDELARVLTYPEFRLDTTRQTEIRSRYATLTQCCDGVAPPSETPLRPLPRCKDPDDQPFLELAVAEGAQLLVTRDHALLRLHKRIGALGLPLQILEPVPAVALLTEALANAD